MYSRRYGGSSIRPACASDCIAKGSVHLKDPSNAAGNKSFEFDILSNADGQYNRGADWTRPIQTGRPSSTHSGA